MALGMSAAMAVPGLAQGPRVYRVDYDRELNDEQREKWDQLKEKRLRKPS